MANPRAVVQAPVTFMVAASHSYRLDTVATSGTPVFAIDSVLEPAL